MRKGEKKDVQIETNLFLLHGRSRIQASLQYAATVAMSTNHFASFVDRI